LNKALGSLEFSTVIHSNIMGSESHRFFPPFHLDPLMRSFGAAKRRYI
jgi:hypothetical protein